jgi:hypothetical protein
LDPWIRGSVDPWLWFRGSVDPWPCGCVDVSRSFFFSFLYIIYVLMLFTDFRGASRGSRICFCFCVSVCGFRTGNWSCRVRGVSKKLPGCVALHSQRVSAHGQPCRPVSGTGTILTNKTMCTWPVDDILTDFHEHSQTQIKTHKNHNNNRKNPLDSTKSLFPLKGPSLFSFKGTIPSPHVLCYIHSGDANFAMLALPGASTRPKLPKTASKTGTHIWVRRHGRRPCCLFVVFSH